MLRTLHPHTAIGLLVLTLLWAGCGNSSPGGVSTLAPKNNAVPLPPEITETKDLIDPSVLATLPRATFFIPLVVDDTPKPETEGAPAEPVKPPEDPLKNVSLAGVVYLSKNPLAILKVGDDKSKIVHVGDVLTTGDDTAVDFKVRKISKDSVQLTVLTAIEGLPASMRNKTIGVSSLIGSRKSSSKSDSGTSATPATPPAAGSK